MTAMEDDRDSTNNSGVMVEDNFKELLQDSDSASSTKVAKAGLGVATFHGWMYKHYIQVISKDSKNLRVRCILCGGNKTLSSARNTTSNFKKHLSSVHKNAKLVTKSIEAWKEEAKK